MGYIIAVIVTALIAIVTNATWFGKLLKVVKEGSEFIAALSAALAPDEDGKIKITPEEAEKLIKEGKDILDIFKKK